ncbi:diphthine synthase [Halobellus sp. Atlit-38R]|uniref:diphthine synthase n=1 Tax=Halobellus sp. Atlit-38R TaxID=2282131 RepID=UPI000EF1D724|nr:diphthine synthase [Halobellus sp. Atlit-38R]RLM94706.1 diphthine synthase [Halobellus sp. Atlit-38R]
MLTFIGLGLYDERSITVEGREALADADRAVAEFYTSHLVGATVGELSAYHDIDIDVRDRAGVEQHPEGVLDAAEDEHVAFLTAGDTMISTTHVDLRLRAIERGIDTRVIHGVTAQTAASGLTGLQNYRFGKAVTLPFPYAHGADGVPQSVVDSIEANRERGLHTVVYLDIKAEREEYMTADVAAEMLAADWQDVLGVVVARAGSPEPTVVADRLSELATEDFGDPLHLLVIPGDLHHVESDALATLGGAPADVLEANEV